MKWVFLIRIWINLILVHSWFCPRGEKINLNSNIRKFNIPRKEHPVISANMPKLPPKLAILSFMLHFASITLISGSTIFQRTITRSSAIAACFNLKDPYIALYEFSTPLSVILVPFNEIWTQLNEYCFNEYSGFCFELNHF